MNNPITIVTEAGTVYSLTSISRNGMHSFKRGDDAESVKLAAVYPDRVEHLRAARKFEKAGPSTVDCLNTFGRRTIQLRLDDFRKGMVLASPRGHKSTPIVHIEWGTL
jgi:hypothetical protein